MSLADISRLVVFPGGTIPSGGVSSGDLAAAVATLDGRLDALEAPGNVGTADIADNAVTNVKLADMAEARIKGRAAGAGAGDPQDLTASQARTAMGLGTAATADADDFATASGLSDEITAREAADNLGDIVRLSSVTGTANAASGNVQAAQAHMEITGRQRIQSLWPTTNTTANPTLTIGATAYTIKRRDGSALAAGDLRGGAVYDLVLDPDAVNTLRLMGAVAIPDIAGLTGAMNDLSSADDALFSQITAETDRAIGAEAVIQDALDSRIGIYSSREKLAVLLDDEGYQTDFDIDRATGQFAQVVVDRLAERIGVQARTSRDILLALLDDGEYPTDIEIRRADGRITDRVMGLWADRIGTILGANVASSMTYLFALLDSAGYPTDLEIRRSDGRITDRVVSSWAERMGLIAVDSGESLFALTDDGDYPTDLEIRRADGRLSNRVVAELADRTRAFAAIDGTDMTQIAAWGSSGIDLMGGHLNAMAAELGATYRHGGDSGARSDMILARMGVEPYRAYFPNNTIPESGSVTISMAYGIPHEYSNAMDCWAEGTGARGTLTSTGTGGFVFTRATGATLPVVVDGPVRLLPIEQSSWRRGVQIVQIGKNDALFLNAGWENRLIRSNILPIDRHPSIDRRVICLGQYTARDEATHAPIAAGITAANDALRARYGDQFFDLLAYISGPDVWTDTGITPNSTDLAAQSAGRLAPSLAADNIHLNDTTNAAVADQLKALMQNLGWY